MKYQLGYYDPGPETWRFHRDVDTEDIVQFDSLEDAKTAAILLSKTSGRIGHGVIVLTMHAAFITEVTYPKPEPIYTTREVAVRSSKP